MNEKDCIDILGEIHKYMRGSYKNESEGHFAVEDGSKSKVKELLKEYSHKVNDNLFLFDYLNNFVNAYPLCFSRYKMFIRSMLFDIYKRRTSDIVFVYYTKYISVYYRLIHMGLFDVSEDYVFRHVNSVCFSPRTNDIDKIKSGFQLRSSDKKYFGMLKEACLKGQLRYLQDEFIYLPIIEPFIQYMSDKYTKFEVKSYLIYSFCNNKLASSYFSQLSNDEKVLSAAILDDAAIFDNTGGSIVNLFSHNDDVPLSGGNGFNSLRIPAIAFFAQSYEVIKTFIDRIRRDRPVKCHYDYYITASVMHYNFGAFSYIREKYKDHMKSSRQPNINESINYFNSMFLENSAFSFDHIKCLDKILKGNSSNEINNSHFYDAFHNQVPYIYFKFSDNIDDKRRKYVNVFQYKIKNHKGKIHDSLLADLGKVTGLFESVSFFGIFSKCVNLVEFVQPKELELKNVTDLDKAFYGCSSLKTVELHVSKDSRLINLNHLFSECSGLRSLKITFEEGIQSKIEDVSYMFNLCTNINEMELINFDTSSASNFRALFKDCKYIRKIPNFNTSNGKDMSRMFMNCEELANLDMEIYKTESVTNFNSLFYNSGLRNIDVSKTDFSNVTNVSHMFENCKYLQKVSFPEKSMQFSNVKNMSYMFKGCEKIKSLDLACFVLSDVENMDEMFKGCYSLMSLRLSQIVDRKATKVNSMFVDCSNLTIWIDGVQSLDSGFVKMTGLKQYNLNYDNIEELNSKKKDFSNLSDAISFFWDKFEKTEADDAVDFVVTKFLERSSDNEFFEFVGESTPVDNFLLFVVEKTSVIIMDHSISCIKFANIMFEYKLSKDYFRDMILFIGIFKIFMEKLKLLKYNLHDVKWTDIFNSLFNMFFGSQTHRQIMDIRNFRLDDYMSAFEPDNNDIEYTINSIFRMRCYRVGSGLPYVHESKFQQTLADINFKNMSKRRSPTSGDEYDEYIKQNSLYNHFTEEGGFENSLNYPLLEYIRELYPGYTDNNELFTVTMSVFHNQIFSYYNRYANLFFDDNESIFNFSSNVEDDDNFFDHISKHTSINNLGINLSCYAFVSIISNAFKDPYAPDELRFCRKKLIYDLMTIKPYLKSYESGVIHNKTNILHMCISSQNINSVIDAIVDVFGVSTSFGRDYTIPVLMLFSTDSYGRNMFSKYIDNFSKMEKDKLMFMFKTIVRLFSKGKFIFGTDKSRSDLFNMMDKNMFAFFDSLKREIPDYLTEVQLKCYDSVYSWLTLENYFNMEWKAPKEATEMREVFKGVSGEIPTDDEAKDVQGLFSDYSDITLKRQPSMYFSMAVDLHMRRRQDIDNLLECLKKNFDIVRKVTRRVDFNVGRGKHSSDGKPFIRTYLPEKLRRYFPGNYSSFDQRNVGMYFMLTRAGS